MKTLTFTTTDAPRMDKALDVAALRTNESRLRYGPSRHAILETLSYHHGPPITFTQVRNAQPEWMFKIALDSGWEYRAMRLMSNLGFIQRFSFEGGHLAYWAITAKGRAQLKTWNEAGFNNARSLWDFVRSERIHYVRNGRTVTRNDKWVHQIDPRNGQLYGAQPVGGYPPYEGAR